LSSIKLKLEDLGLDVPEDQYAQLLADVKEQATAAGRLMTDEEFRQLVNASRAA
jgi:isopropylmalate/homocitrate/citramalate synthase